MLSLHVRDLGYGRFIVQVWNDEGRFARGPASFKNKETWRQVVELLNNNTPVPPSYLRFMELDASQLAGSLPWAHMVVKHPVHGKDMGLMETIIDLNDHHGWTREKIADWVETLPDVPKFEVA